MADSTPDAAIGVHDDEGVETLLRERAAHLPAHDGAEEAGMLAGLAQALADDPEDAMQRLADAVRALCGADAVVVAVLDGAGDAGRTTPPDAADTVRWCVVSGALDGHRGEQWSVGECACGTVIRADGAVLVERPTEHFPSLRATGIPVAEFLGVPWRVRGGALGALAVVLADGGDARFDADDLRLLRACAPFAAAAHQAGGSKSASGVEIEREVEERLRPVLESKEHLEREVEESRAAERVLLDHKALVDATLSISTVGVLYFDIDGTVRDVNPAFERMTGYTCAELRAMPNWRDMTPPEFWDVSARALRDLIDHGVTLPYTKQMTRKDGSRWWGLFAPARISGAACCS